MLVCFSMLQGVGTHTEQIPLPWHCTALQQQEMLQQILTLGMLSLLCAQQLADSSESGDLIAVLPPAICCLLGCIGSA